MALVAPEEPRELNPDVLTPREFVTDAYGRWTPDRLDLFHDMSAEEGFIVDGEALIMEGFSNWNVEWPEGCGQLLHVVYVVEKLLHDFVIRNGMFSIVFFDSNRAFWVSDPAKLLARDCIVRHLRATLPKIVFTFENWWSDSWSEFVRVQIPSFILTHDGEQLKHIIGKPDADDTDADIQDVQFVIRAFMVDCIVKRMHTVYTTRLVKKDSFIHGFVVRANSGRFLPMGKNVNLKGIYEECIRLFGTGCESTLAKIEKEQFPSSGRWGVTGESLLTVPGLDEEAFRVRLGGVSVREVLADESLTFDGMKTDLAKAFVLHLLVTQMLPLDQRAQSLTEVYQEADERSPYFSVCDQFVKACTSRACVHSTSTASDFNTAAVKAREEADAKSGEFSDSWDFRLVRKIIGLLLGTNGALTGPKVLVDRFEQVWKAITGAAPEGPILTIPTDTPPEVHVNSASTFALLPTEDALVNKLIEGIPVTEMPEAKATKTLTQLQEKQGWLQRSQKWIAQDLPEVIRGDDLYKATQAAFADTYDTTNVSERKKRKMERRMEKSRAKFLHAIQAGAESMSNGFLPHAESRVITKEQDKDKNKPAKQAKLGSKAAEIAEKNKIALEQKEKDSQERAWGNFYSRLEMKKDMSIEKLSNCATDIQKFIGLKKVSDPVMLVKAKIERLKLLERQWIALCKDPKMKEKSTGVAVDLFRGVHEMVRDYVGWAEKCKREKEATPEEQGQKHKDKKAAKKKPEKKADASSPEPYKPLFGDEEMQILRRILVMLGLRENCKRIDQEIAKTDGIEYQKDGAHKLPSSKSAVAKMERIVSKDAADPNDRSHVRFQMSKMGHLFERSVGQEDHRVKFKPDPWQKAMLDYVDNRESILCCAPTSAGKTFISYYCIKEVMFSSNENVVVYVAPTRALCNQAAQDVYAIFGHKKYSANGWSLFGILGGGNYVQPLPPMGGPFMTQVLITIPSVFEHVMLAPRYQQWARRVKYVIFDEVHCVDTSGEGHLWERLLMCCRAPFLALSATVGNANDFKKWLSHTQDLIKKQDQARGAAENRSYEVRGVYWNQRWNDLQKFTYQPRTPEERSKTKVKISNAPFAIDNVKPVHPFSTVTRTMLDKLGEFPQDLPLVPRECLDLYDAMLAAFEEVSVAILGTWSDDEGNKVNIESDGTMVGRRGHFKGLTGKKVEEIPKPPLQDDFDDFKATVCFDLEGGGMVWGGVNEDDELELILQRGGKVRCVTADHELDEGILEAMSGGDSEKGLLCPEEFFADDIAITQARSREYESALKDELMKWVKKGDKDPIAKMMVDNVMSRLGGGLHKTCETAENVATEQKCALDTKEFIENNFTDLLMCLNSKGMLPAIVFNFDQGLCEDLTKKIVTDLEEAEEKYKATPEWLSFVKNRTELANQQKRDLKNHQAASSNTRSNKKDDEGDGGDGGDAFDEPELVDYSIPDILPAYAFVHGERGDGLGRDDFERVVKDIGVLERTHFLIKALERGIGVHHAGLPVKYRNIVERLFRLKRLKIVVATDGLALGIHSPCRTVVLAGDDVKLSTMQFRQMSGRAGRRGQDFVGHVVFYGIPETKIIRLMTSGLPTLRGHVSVDATTILRMSLLHSHTGPSKGRDRIEVDQEVVKCMSKCMMEPLFLLGKTIAQGGNPNVDGDALYNKMLRLQWRYTTDYLQREGIITPTGGGLYLPGLTTRSLYSVGEIHMNPPNLLMAALLKRGILNKCCAGYTRKDNAMVVAQMSKFLATLFTRNTMGWKQEVHRSVMENPDIQSEYCPHEVMLTPLNELFGGDIWKCLQSYTSDSLEIFSDLARKMAEHVEAAHGKDTKLPMSQVDFAKSDFEGASEGLLGELKDQALDVKARSPFISVCGLKDRFHCVDDLVSSLRSCVHLEEDSLPLIDFIDLQRRDKEDRWVRINAACYDYMIEGPQLIDGISQRQFLQDYNGLSQSLSWNVLNRFITAVVNVTDLVERLAPAWPVPDHVFTCCNTVCSPKFSKFTSENGLYKCHECDKEGIDTWMCPKCYEEGEECVTKQIEEGTKIERSVKNKNHVFFRHVYDRFVQTMSHIAADLDPIAKDLGRSERTTTRKKKKQIEVVKPKRPILQKPQSRGKKLLFKRK